MHFRDEEIDNLDMDSVNDFSKLITKYLCGRKTECSLSPRDKEMVQQSLNCIKKNGLTFEQLNEILLLMNQKRVGEDFFRFFFNKDGKKELIALEDLKTAITYFRGYSLLCFGDFRFAFKSLIYEKEAIIKNKTDPFCKDSELIEESFNKRPKKILDINYIDRDSTPFVGELTGTKLNTEADFLEKQLRIAKKNNDQSKFLDLLKIKLEFVKRKLLIKNTEMQALCNTDVYLTWDCMDVYVATSMRNKWEFEETYDFIHSVFEDSTIKGLNLRYFDPTQSKCNNARDKGLIEGLMLKRSLCAIYMAQEGDTMGKDSELAATLSQSKPVLIYVPKHDPQDYAKKLLDYPLDYFKARLNILDAYGTLKQPECVKRLNKITKDFQKIIDTFLEQLDRFRVKEPYTLVETEQKFKSACKEFSVICQIVSTAECYNYDNRAKLLMGLHPLCMQVNMNSGVTNGVLVVRQPKDCALLLHRLLTNQMNFVIKKNQDCTILEEEISHCAYRVVTDNAKLSNCFWNYFGKT